MKASCIELDTSPNKQPSNKFLCKHSVKYVVHMDYEKTILWRILQEILGYVSGKLNTYEVVYSCFHRYEYYDIPVV